MIDDIEIRPGAAAQRAVTRRAARDRMFGAATTLGRRHGLAGVASLRTQHPSTTSPNASRARRASPGSHQRGHRAVRCRQRVPGHVRRRSGAARGAVTAEGPPSCRSSVLGLICDLRQDHDREVAHHLVVGHCPTHGRPQTKVPDPRTHFPLCGTCGLPSCPGTG